MLIVTVCEIYGWDYYTYLNQPSWFIELIKVKMKVDNDKIKKDLKKKNG